MYNMVNAHTIVANINSSSYQWSRNMLLKFSIALYNFNSCTVKKKYIYLNGVVVVREAY